MLDYREKEKESGYEAAFRSQTHDRSTYQSMTADMPNNLSPNNLSPNNLSLNHHSPNHDPPNEFAECCLPKVICRAIACRVAALRRAPAQQLPPNTAAGFDTAAGSAPWLRSARTQPIGGFVSLVASL
ncbi:hypothetical protein RSSM_01166 [Rhodopirellula sallentina SM41]|uniref:Uncharacterized protein n=1 Tax=Rhodopirellula sallentina SM41 TaxID=1263870 RepID=M5U7B6_9BACT|nr:hypothetical protein RSSM_01166 [Rhodopirellula sallentina SM41]